MICVVLTLFLVVAVCGFACEFYAMITDRDLN